jgi:hypothetical protein
VLEREREEERERERILPPPIPNPNWPPPPPLKHLSESELDGSALYNPVFVLNVME